MTRLTARQQKAHDKMMKALLSGQRTQMKAKASSKMVGSRGLAGKAGKAIAGRVKTTDKKTKADDKGERMIAECGKSIANIVKPASKKIKTDHSLGRAVKKQENNQNIPTKKSQTATPAVKKVKAGKTSVKKGKAATSVAKKGKSAKSVIKKGKAATPVVKRGKATTAVFMKGKVTPAVTKGSKVVARSKGIKSGLLRTKLNKGTTTTLARQTPAAAKGRQLARTVASRGKGAKGLSARTVTPATAVGQERAAREPASDSLLQPPAKLARVDSINTQLRKAIAVATTSSASTSKAKRAAAAKTYKVDDVLKRVVASDAKVYRDYSCMLNQTNIGFNNNKYYVIQVVEDGSFSSKKYIYFSRWGRVGESGQNKVERYSDVDKAVQAFEKKFRDKTHNGWESRHKFTPKPKKYTLLEMDEEDEDESKPLVSKSTTSPSVRSSLDERTQKLARIIFSDNMFKQQMADMNLDVNKMPLGKLSKSQIAKGLEALLDIEEAITKGNRAALNTLTSKFYTLIPHNFGRSVPPVIQAQDVVQQKKDMLITLADIELTLSLQKTKGAAAPTQNPLDAKMDALGCKLVIVERTAPEFKWIREYASACPNTRKHTLLDVWRVDRLGEHTRFSRNDSIKYRKLLWHGTSVAVVAAILNSGLRIMPHSGGRVGRGIYFASEHAKSSWYVGVHNGAFEGETNIGFMFLVEVALGRMDNITSSSGQQKAAPPGYDSIVARGWTEPDSGDEMDIVYEGKKVIVPKGKPKKVNAYSSSHFSQSEYLVYREDQARLRYLLKFSFT